MPVPSREVHPPARMPAPFAADPCPHLSASARNRPLAPAPPHTLHYSQTTRHPTAFRPSARAPAIHGREREPARAPAVHGRDSDKGEDHPRTFPTAYRLPSPDTLRGIRLPAPRAEIPETDTKMSAFAPRAYLPPDSKPIHPKENTRAIQMSGHNGHRTTGITPPIAGR